MNKNEKLEKYYARCDMSQIKGHLKTLLENAKKEIREISIENWVQSGKGIKNYLGCFKLIV